jgi:hypothetical protein
MRRSRTDGVAAGHDAGFGDTAGTRTPMISSAADRNAALSAGGIRKE